MEITVKEAKVISTGTNKNGDWELVKVTSEDGTEYTTFDKKAKHLVLGAVVDIGDVTLKEGNKRSFKEYTVKSVPATPASPVDSGDQMNKEDWAKKQRIERESIESQVAVKCVFSLITAIMESDKKVVEINEDLKRIAPKALAWCEAKIEATMPAKEAKTTPKATEVEQASPPGPGNETPPANNIDTDWLSETLGIIRWSETTALTWMKANLKVEAIGQLLDVCNSLPAEKLQEFCQKLQSLREAAGN